MWAYTDLPMMALLLAAIGGDNISGELGEEASNAVIGKNNRQDIHADRQNVNVYNRFDDNDGDHRSAASRRNASDRELIDSLVNDVYGRADYWPGVIRRQNKLIEDLSVLRKQFQTILFWQYFLMAVIALIVVLGIINLIVLRLPI